MTLGTNPSATLGLEPSFGFGDRLGLATPGHLEALGAEGGPIKPVFAQQSIREMTRTRRTPTEVMTTAAEALRAADYQGRWGSDADHLKTEQDVDNTADAGFVFFTIDPSEHVDQSADRDDPATLGEKFDSLKNQIDWVDQYRGKRITVEDGPVLVFDDMTVKRAAVKYGKAIAHARSMAVYIRSAAERRRQDYEIELSVDETEHPTTLAEHYIIASQCIKAGVKLVSLALRYIGDFEKGVDYKGDPAALNRSLHQHAAIARQLGPYKLSLHSGSDKLSMYGPFAKATRGMFHVKTAGTSYLEALRVVAHRDEALFRSIVDFARSRYDTDKATYHVSATIEAVPPPAAIPDGAELERLYLDCWSDVADGHGFTQPGRQILHCTFGSVLTDERFSIALADLLRSEPDAYRQVLAEHFAKHLAALCGGTG